MAKAQHPPASDSHRGKSRVAATFGFAVATALGAACQLSQPQVTGPKEPSEPAPATSKPDAAAPAETPPAQPGITLGDAGPAGPAPDTAATTGTEVLVYAHSGSDLFKVNPQSLEITRVGPFVTAAGRYFNTVTDIAIDKQGKMLAITFDQLLEIDSATAQARIIVPLPGGNSLNGLSWIRTESGEEFLAATGNDVLLRIDAATGTAKPVGKLGMGHRSSGDIVSVQSYGTLVTLRGDGIGDGSDQLAKLDPSTGAATVIGPTGFKKVWGVAFWGNRVFGFTQTGQFILIDPKTGMGTLIQQMTAFPFWGAGVSTSVPVVVD